jgi:hypothetical protein
MVILSINSPHETSMVGMVRTGGGADELKERLRQKL